jgi:hypothetical protein
MNKQQSGPRHSREVGAEQRLSGCLAPPLPLHRFPGIPFEYAEILKSKGINHSGNFMDMAETAQQCILLARTTGIPENRISELRSLCDLARIRGIDPRLARVIYQVNIRSVGKMAKEDPASLYQKISKCSEAYAEVITSLQVEEMDAWIECAKIILLSEGRSPE